MTATIKPMAVHFVNLSKYLFSSLIINLIKPYIILDIAHGTNPNHF